MTSDTTRQITHSINEINRDLLDAPDWTWFGEEVTRHNYRIVRSVRAHAVYDTLHTLLHLADRVISDHQSLDDSSRFPAIAVQMGSALVRLVVTAELVGHLLVIGETHQSVDRALELLASAIEADGIAELAPHETMIRLWSHNTAGAESIPRIVGALTCDDMLRGLDRTCSSAIKSMIDTGPTLGGLHVWHGVPGCGKTTAIRTLARTWANGCAVEVVLDPANFLESPFYMHKVLRAHELAPSLAHAIRRQHTNRPRRILILEDSGEFVSNCANTRRERGISGLLNLTDGMFGEHNRPIVLLTTNEDVGKLHPAITRPGRCRSVVEFRPLDPDHANQWLAEQGRSDLSVSRATTIAELAALVDDTTPISAVTAVQKVGFAV